MGIEMSQQALISIIAEIISLFRESDDVIHLRQFEELYSWAKDAKSTEDQSSLARLILRLYGGMGSFNDTIIYRNGIIDKSATSKLNKLRDRLFETARNLL